MENKMSEFNETLKSEISEQCRDSSGLMKLPGSIVGGFTKAQIKLAVTSGWVKRVGNKAVLTQKGYKEL